MNAEQKQLLIMISEDEELEWIQMVQKTWQTVGKMEIISEATAMQSGISTIQTPSFIIIDASSIHHDLVSLVKEIHQQFENENVPIVVASASPNWEQARDVFHAGAADYIKRTTDIQSLVQLLKNYAGRASPPNQ
jgi:DNA-binding response OmpR family regulator